LAVVKLLLAEPSIDINAKDRNDATPLWWATRGNYEHVAARLLAEPNADINTVGQFENPLPTVLHHAVQGRSDLIIRLLLMEKSLDPNILDHQGQTPWAGQPAGRCRDGGMAAHPAGYPSECSQSKRTTTAVVSCVTRPYPSGSAPATVPRY
jgi:hypothetical protein